ncbi:uncharacterized protein LOC114828268 [Galendromus occidentalis]|uniref:Uncharacterized protein LOC114828268 n=1 Tax=Galendromus occidentalis TaxID=34638 RepID=A0AAJ7SF91_9ACAR|nr:uncharacterized protein LOC114828268 [Galendromus occidentalis]
MRLPIPLDPSDALTDVENPAPPERIHIPLEDRLLDGCVLSEEDLRAATNDVILHCIEGEIVRTKSILVRNMSLYFRTCYRWDEGRSARGDFDARVTTYPTLRAVANFFETGNLELRLQNIQQLYMAIHYLEVPHLLEACRDYLESHLPETAVIALHLACFYEDMEELEELAASSLAENVDKYKSLLFRLPGQFMAAVISQDNLKVRSEDEVLGLLTEWKKRRRRAKKEISKVLEFVRYPHLTPAGLEKAYVEFSGLIKSASASSCRNGALQQVPVEQLTRRRFYSDHIHLIWSETPGPPCELNGGLDSRVEFKTSCLRCSPDGIISHKTLHDIPELRSGNERFEFVTVMNSLHMLTHSNRLNEIVVYKQEQDYDWDWQCDIARDILLEEFCACAYEGKIVFTMFTGYGDNIRCIEVDTLSSDGDPRILDLRQPPNTYYSALQMSLHDDWLIYLRVDKVQLSSTKREDFRELCLESYGTPRGLNPATRFASYIRCDNYLYIYKDVLTVSPTFRRVRGLFDQVLKMNVNTQTIEKTIDVRKPLYSKFKDLGRSKVRMDKSHVRRTFVSGSKLLVALQEDDSDHCRLVQMDEDEDEFPILADVRVSDPQRSYHRRLEYVVPIHVHHCDHTTVLNEYCRNLRHPQYHDVLERLAYYL